MEGKEWEYGPFPRNRACTYANSRTGERDIAAWWLRRKEMVDGNDG
jgi:hypothetical protein